MVLDHRLPSLEPKFFFEWTRTRFEQCLDEFCAPPLEEHLQVASGMLEMEYVPHSIPCSICAMECKWNQQKTTILLPKPSWNVLRVVFSAKRQLSMFPTAVLSPLSPPPNVRKTTAV
jgi:hypothetical protein